MRKQLTPDIKLPSGRTITHKLRPSGTQEAIPTSGPDELTDEEWLEYCDIIRQKAKETINANG